MRSLTPSELLSVWEQGQGQSSMSRGLLLLGVLSGDEVPAKLSIGRRDALLLSLRESLFGSRLVSIAACPRCSEKMELTFDASDIRIEPDGAGPRTLTVTSGGYEAEFRLPDSEDLRAVASEAADDPAVAGESLLARCLIAVRCRTGEGDADSMGSPGELPPPLIAAIAEAMEKADPQANVQLDLSCAACSHRWQAPFDILSYLWSEIDDWARRILREVHVLASAYGWREADILAMSVPRRQMYLELQGVS